MKLVNVILEKIRQSKAVKWLLLINVVVCVLIGIINVGMTLCGKTINGVYVWLGVDANISAVIRHPWTLLTYMFTQASAGHLIVNLIWLFVFGVALENRVGVSKLVKLYIFSGLVGAFFYLFNSGIEGDGSHAVLLGSSASIMGLTSAAWVLIGRKKVKLPLFGTENIGGIASVALMSTLITGIYSTEAAPTCAHAGGAIAGLVIAFTIKRKNIAPEGSSENTNAVQTVFSLEQEGKVQSVLMDKLRLSGYESLNDSKKNKIKDDNSQSTHKNGA